MKEIYISYYCKSCKKTIILLTDEANDTVKHGKYIACSHCGSKRIFEENKMNDLRKCMDHDAYKRINGKVRQVHYE